MKRKTSARTNSINHSPLRGAFILIALVLAFAWFALSPHARATCQEGCLTNNNTVLGDDALLNNTTGHDNTATGFDALLHNMIGSNNTANGSNALFSNTKGSLNTATGSSALVNNTTGSNNTANGLDALRANTTGFDNTANGVNALFNNTTGGSNVALGNNAGMNLTTGSNNIDIGNVGMAGESKHIRIGTSGTQTKTFVAGISGVTVPGGVGVIVGTNGQLGKVVSSESFKDSIKQMDKASEALLALKT